MTNTRTRLSTQTIAAVFNQARKDELWSAWPAHLKDPARAMMESGLIEPYLTMRGGRGQYVRRVRTSQDGRVWWSAQQIALPEPMFEVAGF